MTSKITPLFRQTNLFSPSVIRRMTYNSSVLIGQQGSTLSASNITSTSSFRYDTPGAPLKSTQQIPLDFSKFENHTFFNSAESKTNIAFEKIINNFPFDGDRKEFERFFDEISGFEKYVYDRFPKYRGFLWFSGTAVGEDPERSYSAELGSFIKLPDAAGSLLPSLSKIETGQVVIGPSSGQSLAFEFHVFIPPTANDNQVIFQKRGNADAGITVGLQCEPGVLTCSLFMCIASGSSNVISASMPITKGNFNHVCAVLDQSFGQHNIKLYTSGNIQATSQKSDNFGDFAFEASDLLIGSGSMMRTGSDISAYFNPTQTFSGALEELRIWNTPRTSASQKKFQLKNVFADPTLRLYYRFNEPSGSYTNNNLVLDSSGNSLHGKIDNFLSSSRQFAEATLPLRNEQKGRNPILFPSQEEVVSLNYILLYSASIYDVNNPNLITQLVPSHYFQEAQYFEGFAKETGNVGQAFSTGSYDFPGGGKIGSPQIVTLLLLMWSSYFDELKIYTDHFSRLMTVKYNEDESVSNQFLQFLGEYYGFPLPSFYTNAQIKQYNEGEDMLIDASFAKHSLRYIQNQMWRRILINFRSLTQSKGTTYSIKALMRACGVDPDNNFRFREFGGQKTRYIDDARIMKSKIFKSLDFSGSMAGGINSEPTDTVGSTLDDAGFSTRKPHFMSSFLSGSRIEVGFPPIAGTMVGLKFLSAEFKIPSNADVTLDLATWHDARFVLTDTTGLAVMAYLIDNQTVTTGQVHENVTIGYYFFIGLQGCVNQEDVKGRIITTINNIYGPSIDITATDASPSAAATDAQTIVLTQGAKTSFSAPSIPIPRIMNPGKLWGFAGSTPGAWLAPAFTAEYSGPHTALGAATTVHGTSDDPNDGLFTSGSWTVEALYQFRPPVTGSIIHFPTQSLMRLHATGGLMDAAQPLVNQKGQYAILNCLAISGSVDLNISSSLELHVRPGRAFKSTASPVDTAFKLVLTGVNICDGQFWHVSFGRVSPENWPNKVIHHEPGTAWAPTASYFLRAGRQNMGEIANFHHVSAPFGETHSVANGTFFTDIGTAAQGQADGLFLAVGSQSLQTGIAGTYRLPGLNDINYAPVFSRQTGFSGQIGKIRFWSKALDLNETRTHIRDPTSIGISNPMVNWNFVHTPPGAFERLRLDVSIDQIITASDIERKIELFDYTQNFFTGSMPGAPWRKEGGQTCIDGKFYYVMSASGFEPSDPEVTKYQLTHYTMFDPKFDERSAFNKIRIRSFQDVSNIDDFRTQAAPVYEILKSEEPLDDTRFLIEASFINALNEDIIKIFSTLDEFDNILGNPEMMFAENYPDLRVLRDIYFNRLTGKVRIKEFFEFFKWFDDTMGIMIEQLLPKKTEFLGFQFTIESHMLERTKFRYGFGTAYVNQRVLPLSNETALRLTNIGLGIEGPEDDGTIGI